VTNRDRAGALRATATVDFYLSSPLSRLTRSSEVINKRFHAFVAPLLSSGLRCASFLHNTACSCPEADMTTSSGHLNFVRLSKFRAHEVCTSVLQILKVNLSLPNSIIATELIFATLCSTNRPSAHDQAHCDRKKLVNMTKQSIRGVTDFDPSKDLPSLVGKVILVTGG
jgi:hypothetical protein